MAGRATANRRPESRGRQRTSFSTALARLSARPDSDGRAAPRAPAGDRRSRDCPARYESGLATCGGFPATYPADSPPPIPQLSRQPSIADGNATQTGQSGVSRAGLLQLAYFSCSDFSAEPSFCLGFMRQSCSPQSSQGFWGARLVSGRRFSGERRFSPALPSTDANASINRVGTRRAPGLLGALGHRRDMPPPRLAVSRPGTRSAARGAASELQPDRRRPNVLL